MKLQNNLVSAFQLWGVEDGITLFQEGSFGFAFKIKPIDISCYSDDSINQIRSRLKTFLNALPKNIDIQFMQSIDRGGSADFDKHEAFAENAPSLVKSLTHERAEKFRNLDFVGDLPKQDILFLVRVSLPKDLSPKRSLLSYLKSEKVIMQMHEDDFKNALKWVKILKQDIESNLIATGLSTTEVLEAETVKKSFDVWNPGHSIGLEDYDTTDLRENILCSELVKDIKGFRLGVTHHRVVTLKTLPEQTFAGMASSLLALPFASRLYLSIGIPDQDKEIEWLKMNRRLAYSMVMGKKGVSDIESETKLKDIEVLLNEVIQDGEKIFHTSFSVVLRSEDEAQVDFQVGQVLQTIREMANSEGFLETYASFDVFSNNAFPNTIQKERTRRLKTSNVVDLIPIYGLWNGFDSPSVLMRTRAGSLFKFDPFSSRTTNANQIISGGSGSGKSFLTNLLIGQMLSQNPKVFIIDVGASYKKTCDLLDGQYVGLSTSAGFSINPFDIGESIIPSDEKIKFLVALIEVLTKEDGEARLGRLERSEIELSIQEVYQTHKKPRLSNLREILLKNQNHEVSRIGKILSPWVGDAPFGKIIDRDTTISLDKRLVCFDLKNLESTPDLQAACLLIITDLVWREVQKDRSEMKFLVFDESWRLLESDAGSSFIGEVYRTFRKYYASAIAISQNIDDFAKSKAAAAIMPNASIKWILRQKGADRERLKSVLHLNDREVQLIDSLSQVKGKYSESFLMCEDDKGIVSIEATPLEYWLATTDPKDYSLMTQIETTTGFSGEQLLRHLADKFPKGAERV